LSFLSRLFGNREDALAPVRPLWHRVVEIAREKAWYADYDLADTVPGRFDAITLVLALVLLRMEQDEALIEPSVRLTEIFIDDMDGQLRQTGLGDLVVGKHVGKMMGLLGGRLGAYRDGLAEGNLRTALIRNLYRGEAPADKALAHTEGRLLALRDSLAAMPVEAIVAGTLPG
jgi:cytochrome b pre-mRNA-processing protein 3